MTNVQNLPCYAIISQDGYRYTVVYHAYKGEGYAETGASEGYETNNAFSLCPPDLPVIDYRTADRDKVIEFAIMYEPPRETVTAVENLPLEDYLKLAAEKTGATIRTISEITKP